MSSAHTRTFFQLGTTLIAARRNTRKWLAKDQGKVPALAVFVPFATYNDCRAVMISLDEIAKKGAVLRGLATLPA